ncbi:hypothetical protein ILUMI_08424 [Ignelater luminosus]|uniref:Uncharacterized protein n=1 Tax=Ignelater luminosus TaxID=2038154 RepID=A0A8K0D5Q3_IGNLU|nr:hypothetical protein ILUMI_08424 [Ignelater luminosus]
MYPEIHRYYQLLDRDTSTVTSLWKVLHLTCLAIASISGFITAYAFGKSIEAFGDNCILNAKLEFTGANYTRLSYFVTNALPPDLKPIDIAASEWTSMKECYFCQFTPLVSMIYAIIWGSFFIICSRGGAGYITDAIYRPWRIVYPAMFFAAIATVVLLISSVQLNSGINAFCKEFEVVFNTTKCTTDIDKYTLTFSPKKRQFISILRIAVFCSFTCFMGWLVLLMILILRVVCIADFHMIRITVTPKEEEIMDIINPDDYDDVSLLSSENVSLLDERVDSGHKFFFFPRRRKMLDIDEEERRKHHTVAFDVFDASEDNTQKKKNYGKASDYDEEDDKDRKWKRKPIFGRSGSTRQNNSGLGIFRRPGLFTRKTEEPSDNTSSASPSSFALEAERRKRKSDAPQHKSISTRQSSHLLRLYEEKEIYKPESTFSLVQEDSKRKRKTGTEPSTFIQPSSPRMKELEKDSWSTTSFPFTPQGINIIIITFKLKSSLLQKVN